MRKYLVFAILFALAGCQSIGGGGQPIQLGKKKFEISYSGPEGAGAQAAQEACVSKGYAYAAVVRHSNSRVAFYCMQAGERLSGVRTSRGKFICMDAANGAKVCGQFQ